MTRRAGSTPTRLLLVMVVILLIGAITSVVPQPMSGQNAQSNIAWIQHAPFLGAADSPILFVIEENHASLQVQREVRRILESLHSSVSVSTVLVEGTPPLGGAGFSHPLDLGEIYRAGSCGYREAVASAWFDHGLLTGIEMAALCPEEPAYYIYGVEDPDVREEHLAAMDVSSWVSGYLRSALDALLADLTEPDITLAELTERPQTPTLESSLPTLLEATARLRTTLMPEQIPTVQGLTFEEVLGSMAAEIRSGASLRSALDTVGRQHPNGGTIASSVAAWSEDLEEATETLYAGIIEEAAVRGLDTSLSQSLLEGWRESLAAQDEALDARHARMLGNIQSVLRGKRLESGILVVGAAHTSSLRRALEDLSITHMIITPCGLRKRDTTQQEFDWWYRNLRLEGQAETPLGSWLSGYKPTLALAQPRHQKALAATVSLMEMIGQALSGEPVPAPLVVGEEQYAVMEVESLADAVVVSAKGPSERTLRIEVAQEPGKAYTPFSSRDVYQLAYFIQETLEPGDVRLSTDELRAKEDLAVRLYARDHGLGMLVACRPSEDVQVIRVVRADELVKDPSALTDEYMSAFGEDFRATCENPSVELSGNYGLLKTLCDDLDSLRAGLDVAQDRVIPVALQFDESVSDIRRINLNVLHALMQVSEVKDWSASRFLFVNSAYQGDSPQETSLGKTLHNIHAYGETEREILVVTAPKEACTLEEWEQHPYAQALTAEWKLSQRQAWQHYVHEYGPRITRMVNLVGPENACFPSNAHEMLDQLAELLEGSASASITITLLAHSDESDTRQLAFPQGMVSLADLLWTLGDLQWRGSLPSSPLIEWNVIACNFGVESSASVLGSLGARLVLASPNSVDLYGATYFYEYVTAKTQLGFPLHEAYVEALKELLHDIKEGGVGSGLDDLHWIPQLYSVNPATDDASAA